MKGENTIETIQWARNSGNYLNWTFNNVLLHLSIEKGVEIYCLGLNEYLTFNRSEWTHFWTGIRQGKQTVIDSESYTLTKRTYREMYKILHDINQ